MYQMWVDSDRNFDTKSGPQAEAVIEHEITTEVPNIPAHTSVKVGQTEDEGPAAEVGGISAQRGLKTFEIPASAYTAWMEMQM